MVRRKSKTLKYIVSASIYAESIHIFSKKMLAGLSRQFQDYLANKTEFTAQEREEARWRRLSFQAFAFVVFVIGIPIWWLTTTPYRANLPILDSEYATHLEQMLEPFRSNGTEVWDSLELHSDYNLHLIFIHNRVLEEDVDTAREIQRKLSSFSHQFLRPIGVKIGLSSEHLWDFALHDFLLDYGPKQAGVGSNLNLMTIDSDGQVPAALASELDRLSSPPVGKEALLKIAVFFNNGEEGKPKLQIRHNQKLSDGLAIASWGGIVSYKNDKSSLLNAMMAILQLQLSIPSSVNSGGAGGLEAALKWHQQRLALHNMLQTVRALNALHELASQIEDMVISDEVAAFATESKANFLRAYDQLVQHNSIDSESAAEARRLAEHANGHQSLLELLNFPSDQKYGIYVPLFLPLLVPLFQPVAFFLLFLMAKLKENRRSKSAEKSKSSADTDEKKTDEKKTD